MWSQPIRFCHLKKRPFVELFAEAAIRAAAANWRSVLPFVHKQ
jgi:hypothetical protein